VDVVAFVLCEAIGSGDLREGAAADNLVSMTRSKETLSSPGRAAARRRARPSRPPGHWLLQDAKARFSELVRRVRSEGPQHVTVHGRDEVVVVSAEEFRRLKGERSGDALIAAMQASPYRDIDIEPKRDGMPVRGIDL
jgi:prevent-host-death family protein